MLIFTSNRKSESTIPALSYLQRLRKPEPFHIGLDTTSSRAWYDPELQEAVLECRAAILASRHLEDHSQQKDTSYETFELTMAHADLTFWRGLREQLSQGPAESKEALEAIFQLVRF
jgi:hypothetical protein